MGSRGADLDFTVGDEPSDCSWNGAPTWTLAVDMHNLAVGAPPQALNHSGIADGMVGGILPTLAFYVPVNST